MPPPTRAIQTRKSGAFVSNQPVSQGKPLFAYDTRIPGNGNAGHEGAAYGTTLSDADKWALLEYLKTF